MWSLFRQKLAEDLEHLTKHIMSHFLQCVCLPSKFDQCATPSYRLFGTGFRITGGRWRYISFSQPGSLSRSLSFNRIRFTVWIVKKASTFAISTQWKISLRWHHFFVAIFDWHSSISISRKFTPSIDVLYYAIISGNWTWTFFFSNK